LYAVFAQNCTKRKEISKIWSLSSNIGKKVKHIVFTTIRDIVGNPVIATGSMTGTYCFGIRFFSEKLLVIPAIVAQKFFQKTLPKN